MGFLKDFADNLDKMVDDVGDDLIDFSSSLIRLYQVESNRDKPRSYQEVAMLTTTLHASIIKLSSQNERITPAMDRANLLIMQLTETMKSYDKESKTLNANNTTRYSERRQQLQKLEEEFVISAYNILYDATPELTTDDSLWGYIAASINAFTQWVAEFNLIPEIMITRNSFFKPVKETTDILYEEQYRVEYN